MDVAWNCAVQSDCRIHVTLQFLLIFMKLTKMPPPTENFFTHRRRSQDVSSLAETLTLWDAHRTRCKELLRATSLPRLLGCLVACGAARILSDPPAQVDDASDTRPFHVDAKGWGGQTKYMCLHKNISKLKSSYDVWMGQCMNALADKVHKQDVPCTQWCALHNMATLFNNHPYIHCK